MMCFFVSFASIYFTDKLFCSKGLDKYYPHIVDSFQVLFHVICWEIKQQLFVLA